MAASSSTGKSLSSCSEDENELRRGPWTVEEDTLLTQYISENGEGHWNLLAKCSGLRRTGKSCRLRWLNYLKPDVKRGNFSLHEQILILDLHLKWGSRWSKIAKHLPGRTDNEIKNHWRTRVQKQAKLLKLETNSPEFLNIIKMLWIPRLIQKIQESNPLSSSSSSSLDPHHPPENPQICLQNPIYEHNLDAESMNYSPISHLSYDNPTFLPSCVNHDDFNQLDNVGYDLDAINMVIPSTAAINFDQSVGHFYRAESSWVENDFAGCLWNMDELWQYRNNSDQSPVNHLPH